jgi:hypothetical protein
MTLLNLKAQTAQTCLAKGAALTQLSPKGQEWLSNTLRRLQEEMEDKLKNGVLNKETGKKESISECNNEAMRKMAFDSHVPAYNPDEMSGLTVKDLSKIGTTPDIEEWITLDPFSIKLDTFKQAKDVAFDLDYIQILTPE